MIEALLAFFGLGLLVGYFELVAGGIGHALWPDK